MRRRACHLTSVHPALDTRIFYKECVSLVKSGWEVILIAKADKEQVIEGVRVIPFYQFKNRLTRILFSPLKMYFMAKKHKADIYHFHDPELLITGLILRILTRSKVLYDIHENYANSITDRRWIKLKILRVIISKFFYYFERLVCRWMSSNVVVLPEWLNRYPKAILVRNYPILEEVEKRRRENTFVYVGVIGKERSGLEMTLIFVELLKLMSNIKLKLIGKFWEKKSEKEILGIVNNQKNIAFLGYLAFPEVRDVLSRAKYGFVLYSNAKYLSNIPVKMYEYLSHGVIPIFSSFKGFKYEIEKEGWGIGVNPKRPQEAAKKIHAIITDKELMKSLNENLKKYREKYNWESEKRRLLDLYMNLLNP